MNEEKQIMALTICGLLALGLPAIVGTSIIEILAALASAGLGAIALALMGFVASTIASRAGWYGLIVSVMWL